MASDNLEELRKILEDHERRISGLENIRRSEPERVRKDLSVKEFLLSRNPRDDVQRTLAIGYYLEKHRTLSSFNVADLEGGFREAREPVPPNINDKVNLNIRKGHMMEAEAKKDGRKAWNLTVSGEKFVESGFQDG